MEKEGHLSFYCVVHITFIFLYNLLQCKHKGIFYSGMPFLVWQNERWLMPAVIFAGFRYF